MRHSELHAGAEEGERGLPLLASVPGKSTLYVSSALVEVVEGELGAGLVVGGSRAAN